MYGLISKLTSKENERNNLIKLLVEGSGGMPGNLSYVISEDAKDPNGIWVTEVWESRQHHLDSQNLESVKAVIAKGKQMILGFNHRFETIPIGGNGL